MTNTNNAILEIDDQKITSSRQSELDTLLKSPRIVTKKLSASRLGLAAMTHPTPSKTELAVRKTLKNTERSVGIKHQILACGQQETVGMGGHITEYGVILAFILILSAAMFGASHGMLPIPGFTAPSF